jgi:hypothetical protein
MTIALLDRVRQLPVNSEIHLDALAVLHRRIVGSHKKSATMQARVIAAVATFEEAE